MQTRLHPTSTTVARHRALELYGSPEAGVAREASAELQEIARAATLLTDVDGAIVQVLPAGRQVVLASTDGAPDELPDCDSICFQILQQRQLGTVVEDLSADLRFAANRFVDGRSAAVRGWASAPLVGQERVAIGTLCVYSMTPRQFSRDEASLLDQLARAAVKVLDDARHAHRGLPEPARCAPRVA